jgi:hypothetical protein
MTSVVPLTVNERNDPTIDLTAMASSLIDPDQASFEMVIKASKDADDSDGLVLTVGDGLTVISTEPAKAIDLVAEIPASALEDPGTRFWRLDVIVGGKRGTAMYGPLRIRDL